MEGTVFSGMAEKDYGG